MATESAETAVTTAEKEIFTSKSEQMLTRTHEHEHELHSHEHHGHHHDDGCGHCHDDGCSCGHDHGHGSATLFKGYSCSCCGEDGDSCCDGDADEGPAWVLWVRMAAAAALGAVGMFVPMPGWASLTLCVLAWLVASYDLAIGMARDIMHGEIFGECMLMVVASIGALAIGETLEALAVVILYQIGEWLQDRAVDRSRSSISEMLDLRPETANLLDARSEVKVVPPEQVAVGDRVLVRAGERVPVDGTVVSGRASFDTSALTGESLPLAAAEGSELLAGFISTDGAVTVEATHPASESAAARLEDLLHETEKNRAPTESFIRRFAKIYTPVVMGLAVLVAVAGGFASGDAREWINRALTFLVASCPCALVLSIPLGFFGGIGGAAKRGIMVKGGAALETLADRSLSVVFDKTGTLTEGRFEVRDVLPEDGIAREELLRAAACAESRSAHPLAAAIVAAAGEVPPAKDVSELAGLGLIAETDGGTVAAGNAALMERVGVSTARLTETGATAVHVARDGKYLGVILLGDRPKDGAADAIAALRGLGVKDITMLTGDAEAAARGAAEQLGITSVRAGLLPEDKVAEVGKLRSQGGKVLFVGDGLNDAPVLAAADVSIAMANGRNRISVEAADAVIMSGSPARVTDAVRVGRRTVGIVRENTAFALAAKGVVLILAALGFAPMWAAVFADVGVCLLAVLNALRALK